MEHPLLSVILPCYNQSKGLENILKRFQEAGQGVPFELILVDNGSTDNSAEVLKTLLPSYPFARSVRVEKNVGYGHGIFTGLQSARGELLAWSHADLQTDPADVFRAYRIYQNSHNDHLIVKGKRRGRSWQERFVSRGMEIVSLFLLRTHMTEINAQPKLFHRQLLEHLHAPPTDFNFDAYVLYQAKQNRWRIEAFDVVPPRKYGQSNWAATWRSKARTIARSMWFMFKLGLG